MRILQLNVWMGKIEGNLRRFLEQNDFDIICMQEIMASEDTATHLSRLCFDKSGIIKASRMPYSFFAPNWSSKIADGSFELGNLILSKIPFSMQTSEFIHGEYRENVVLGKQPANCLNIQVARLKTGMIIVNHHGFWRPNEMGDEESVKAFRKVAEVVQGYNHEPLVMCGDLNLVHAAPAMRALDFLHDLTDEYHINNTLSGLKYNGQVACDHILVNDQIKVNDFQALDDLLSDHLALAAEVEIVPATETVL